MGIGEVGEMLRRSTVHLRGMNPERGSTGSGVIWSTDGIVVTNAHVARSGPHVVELWDGRSFVAEVKERDPHRDLAKFTLPVAGLPAAKFRTSPVKTGEPLIAVGNPLRFTGAISTGIAHREGAIAGLGRRRWVQAAVRLAPGNSGGPLADSAGEVVGTNTMAVSGGLALAIPSSAVEAFILNGEPPRLGVTVRAVRLRSRFGLLVLNVESGSPAERASLLLGDVLLGTRETRFADTEDLADALAGASSGGLKLRFLRGDQAREREVAILFGGPRRAVA